MPVDCVCFFLPCSCYICRWMDRKQHDCLQVCGPCLMSVGARDDVKRHCDWGEWLTARPSVSAPSTLLLYYSCPATSNNPNAFTPRTDIFQGQTCIRLSGVSLSLGLCQLSSYAKCMMFSLPWGLFCIQVGIEM